MRKQASRSDISSRRLFIPVTLAELVREYTSSSLSFLLIAMLMYWIRWAIVLKLDIIPAHWELHVACIGDHRLIDTLARFHGPGTYHGIYRSRCRSS
jgi:hypothetical protein